MSNSIFRSDDIGKLILRLTVAGLMLFHGVPKLFYGVSWLQATLSNAGLPGFIAYGVYIGEIIAPILLIIGFRTRLAALVLAFDMLVAILLVHQSRIFAVKEMGGGWAIELELLYLLPSLALFYMGGGKYKIPAKSSDWD